MAIYRMIATAAFGIESVVADEVRALGFENVTVENGKIEFDADEKGICMANLWLRSADRVFIKISEFKATSFEDLFQGVKKITWEDYIPEDGEFPVNAKSVKSQLFSLSDIQAISKKAAVERLRSVYKKDWFKETGAKVSILVAILKDVVTVMIDTSGEGLHRRGYREHGNEAPLRETMAAALIKLSRWNPKIPLVDPMCGSGTILIEAAMIGRNIAPGLNRKFACEQWSFIPAEVWKQVRTEAYAAINHDVSLNIQGYDCDPRSVKQAAINSDLAGLEDDIHFQVRDIKDFSTKVKYGYVITNPPYGERLGDAEEAAALYKLMGEKLLPNDTWSFNLITAHDGFEHAFGKKATKNRKLFNGKIKCYYYQYFGQKPPRERVAEEE
jgi:putative N6-adenine-specific DNA methylase